MRIVVSCFSCYLLAQEVGTLESLIFAVKLYFGNNKTFVVAVELINFECVVALAHQIAALVNLGIAAQQKQFLGFVRGYFAFPFIAAQASVQRRSFYSKIALVSTQAHTYRISVLPAQIALYNAVAGVCLLAETVTNDKEFSFNLYCHNAKLLLAAKLHKIGLYKAVNLAVHNSTYVRCLEACAVVLYSTVVEYVAADL